MTRLQSSIFVIDEDPILLHILRSITESLQVSLEVFERAELLLSRLSAKERGVIVLELNLPGQNGLELNLPGQNGLEMQRMLRERGIPLPVIFVSNQPAVSAVVAAMKQGAVDFHCKPVDANEFARAIEHAFRTDAEAAVAHEARERARARWASLAAREQSVCRLVATGLLQKQVAAELGVTVATVHIQRTNAFRKLEIDSVVALLRLLDQIGERD